MAYHPVLYGVQCLEDVETNKREAKEAQEKEAADAEAAAAAAEVEGEEEEETSADAEAVAEGVGEGEEGSADADGGAEEEKAKEDGRLAVETEVLPALKRICNGFLFTRAKKGVPLE